MVLPAPTGPERIGTVSLHLVYGSRADPWVPTEPARHLMVQIWYPGVNVRAYPRAGWVSRGVAERINPPGSGFILPVTHGHTGAPAAPGHLKRALAAGVRGFLPKTAAAEVLAAVIRTIHNGGRYVDPQLAAEAISAGESPLTAREAYVLELAAGGAPVEQIASRAALSPGTVRNYLSAAAGKLGAANRHEAIRIARERSWI